MEIASVLLAVTIMHSDRAPFELWSPHKFRSYRIVEQDDSSIPVSVIDGGVVIFTESGAVKETKKILYSNAVLKLDSLGIPKISVQAMRQIPEMENIIAPGKSSYHMQNNIYYTVNSGLTLTGDDFTWAFQSEPSSSMAAVTSDHKKIIHLSLRDPKGTFMSIIQSEEDSFGWKRLSVKVDRLGIRSNKWGDIGIYAGYNDLCILSPDHVAFLGYVDEKDYADTESEIDNLHEIHIEELQGSSRSIYLIVLNTKFGMGTPVAKFSINKSGDGSNFGAGRMVSLGTYLYINSRNGIYRVKISDILRRSEY